MLGLIWKLLTFWYGSLVQIVRPLKLEYILNRLNVWLTMSAYFVVMFYRKFMLETLLSCIFNEKCAGASKSAIRRIGEFIKTNEKTLQSL